MSAYADIGYLSRLLGEAWAANALLSTAHAGGDPRPFLAQLKERPEVIGLGERQRALDQIQETFGKSMGTMIGITVFFAGLVAFGSVLNAALVSVNERQREIGTLRVLGYTPRQIASIFAGESLLLNVVGIALGVLAGVGFTHLVFKAYDTELYRFPVIILPVSLAVSAALMAAFVAAAQLVVYRLIRRLPWLDVLKIKE
jgi:putative ABC transport system permease protein